METWTMCKHQSGGMSKSYATNSSSGSNQNSVPVHFLTSSPNSCATRCKNESCYLINSDKEESARFFTEKMAVGSRTSNSSSKGYNNEQTEIQYTSQQSGEGNTNKEQAFEKFCEQQNADCGDFEDESRSEKSPMLQGKEPSYVFPTSSSCHNYQFPPLPTEGCSKSSTSDYIPDFYTWNSAPLHKSVQKESIASDCSAKAVNNYLKFQDELEPLVKPPCVPYSSDNNLIDVSSDDNISPIKHPLQRSSSHQYSLSSYSVVRNWLFSNQQILDEVHVHKAYVPKCSGSLYNFSSNNRVNFQARSNVEDESLVRNSDSDLSIRLSATPTTIEHSPDTIVLQRRSSTNWEVNSIRSIDEIRCRSFSLSPTVNFARFETESSVGTDDIPHPLSSFQETDNYMLPERQLTEVAARAAMLPGSSSATRLSLASSFSDCGGPICKICHMVGREGDPLISPCRCSGTMQFIHCGCLMKWLEISSKRSRKPPSCELCQYQYHWHKKFKVHHWQFPHCSRKDVTLHLVFFLSVLVMIACATITILCFKQDKGTKIDPDRTELSHSEITTLICGVLFFLAFFVGMYVEIKARNTIYRLLVKFVYLNQQWYIDEYNKKENLNISV